MIKKYALIIVTFLCTSVGFGQSDIIISQYIETNSGSTPKGIEVFNVSGADIVFSAGNNLQVRQGTNGNPCGLFGVNITSGILKANEVWVIGTTDLTAYATVNGTNLSGTYDQTFFFNGNDALQILLGGVLQDEFGTCGSDPGTSWFGGGVSTANYNLEIKDGLCDGDIDGWTDPSVRFNQIADGSTMTGFGNAPVSCTTLSTSVEFASATYDVNENGVTASICVEISNPSATNNTTIDVVLLPPGGAPHIGSYTTQTLTFIAGDATPKCVTVNITDNALCDDSNTYDFELQNVGGGDSAIIDAQSTTTLSVADNDGASGAIRTLSFEGSDDWTYTGGGIVNSTTNKYNGTSSYRLSFGNLLTTSNVSLVGYQDVSLSVSFASEGCDSNEDLWLDISYDGGSNWTGVGSVKLVDGFNNADLDIGDTNASNPTTVSTNPWIINIPNNETQVRVRLRALGLDTNEHYWVDDLILNGTSTLYSHTPKNGPEGTVVTVSGSSGLSAATAKYNGGPAAFTNISDSEMEVTVPMGATSGFIEVLANSGCTYYLPFTVTNNQVSGCEGGSNLGELFISEVTDATYGSLTYVEIYNATGSPVDLSTYTLEIYANGNTSTTPPQATDYAFESLSGIIGVGDTFVVAIGTQVPLNTYMCSSEYGGQGELADFSTSTLQGINKKTNGHDFIGLYNSGALVDYFGDFGNDSWMNSTTVTGDRGFNFRRINNATPLPYGTNTSNWDNGDWTVINWTGTGSSSCSGNDYSDIGVYDYSNGTPPSITSDPVAPVSSCDTSISLTVGANEGTDPLGLTYQWYYHAPGATNWMAVPNSAPYTGSNTANLLIDVTGTQDLNKYQYYCLVNEGGSCNVASAATRLDIQRAIWQGAAWINGVTPDTGKIVIIDDLYTTTPTTNIDACTLIVKSSRTLNINNSSYVRVVNDIVNNGTIVIQTKGTLVQDGVGASAGTYTNNGTSRLIKQTATVMSDFGSSHIYTYWSTPVKIADLTTVFPNPTGNRRYYFEAENYLDQHTDETTNGIPDDIDDNGDDWQTASGNMNIGSGYAITSVQPIGFPFSDQATFENIGVSGGFNTGDIDVSVYRNNFAGDINWNFIGNPYPSAIDFITFYSDNSTVIDGCAFLWSHATAESGANPGNEGLNYEQDDYAIINLAGCVAGGSQVIPDPYIPSAQGFFVPFLNGGTTSSCSGLPANVVCGTVTFTNSMRLADTSSNDLFFESNEVTQTFGENNTNQSNNYSNKLWINLSSDNGVFNQLMIAYLANATDGYDGMAYDTKRNLSSGNASNIYSLIEGMENDKFAIQAKNSTSLNENEIIPIGFMTSIVEATLYKFSIAQFDGSFFTDNTIYIKDLELDVIHDLKVSDYIFTSNVGEFNDRFEIVFTLDALSTDDVLLETTALKIIDLENGDTKFKLDGPYQMKTIEIIDLLGRTIYKLNVDNASQRTFDLSNLSQSVYMAKVTLTNGQVLTKKAIKRK